MFSHKFDELAEACFRDKKFPEASFFFIDPSQFRYYRAPLYFIGEDIRTNCIDRLAVIENRSPEDVFKARIKKLRSGKTLDLTEALRMQMTDFQNLEKRYFKRVKPLYDRFKYEMLLSGQEKEFITIQYHITHYDILSVAKYHPNPKKVVDLPFLESLDREMTNLGVSIASMKILHDNMTGIRNYKHPLMDPAPKARGPRLITYTPEFAELVLESASNPDYQHHNGEPIIHRLALKFLEPEFKDHLSNTPSKNTMDDIIKEIISGDLKRQTKPSM